MKIHVETGNIYHENVNRNESIYGFLAAQEDATKIPLAYKIDPTIYFKYYLKKTIAPVKNERDDLDTNSTSKFFFYHFNKFRYDHNLYSFKIRHTKIWEDDCSRVFTNQKLAILYRASAKLLR